MQFNASIVFLLRIVYGFSLLILQNSMLLRLTYFFALIFSWNVLCFYLMAK